MYCDIANIDFAMILSLYSIINGKLEYLTEMNFKWCCIINKQIYLLTAIISVKYDRKYCDALLNKILNINKI